MKTVITAVVLCLMAASTVRAQCCGSASSSGGSSGGASGCIFEKRSPVKCLKIPSTTRKTLTVEQSKKAGARVRVATVSLSRSDSSDE